MIKSGAAQCRAFSFLVLRLGLQHELCLPHPPPTPNNQ
jgi:hypothetical protein